MIIVENETHWDEQRVFLGTKVYEKATQNNLHLARKRFTSRALAAAPKRLPPTNLQTLLTN